MDYKKKEIEVHHTVDKNGREIVQVPLGNMNYYATLYADDFTALMEMGVSPSWSYQTGQIKAAADNQPYAIARVIMDAGKGQQVKYLNGDRFDLRRDNLVIASGKAKHRARDLIFKSHRFLSNRPELKHVISGKLVKTSDAGSVMT